MNGLIGKKIGMTSIYNDKGKYVACTVIEASPNVVTQVKTDDTDGYSALQLGYGEAKEKNVSQPMKGHFTKANTTPKRKLVEFRNSSLQKQIGDKITLEEVFKPGDMIHAVGTSKGKGFQGVMKRHGFGGVGEMTHGQHDRQRAPGSIGSSSFPSKVFKGVRMAGRTGGERVKIKNLKVLQVFSDKNLLVVQGAIPGHTGSFVIIEKK
ncbi:MAG: 50S ribosomal protein L3 [Saprospiraceae bacterium]